MCRQHTSLLLLLIVGIGIRASALIAADYTPAIGNMIATNDTIGYQQLALNLFAGGGYRFEGGTATAFRMPGYPVLLLLFHGIDEYHPLGLRLLQIAADGLTIVLVYFTTATVDTRRWSPELSAALIALNPLLIITSLAVIPDALAIAVCATIQFLSVRIVYWMPQRRVQGEYFILPVLVVLLLYLKPSLLGAVSIIVLLPLLVEGNRNARRSILSAAAATALFLFLMFPWIVRNYLQFGAFIPLTTSNGANFYAGNNPDASGGFVSDLPFVLPGYDEVASDQVYRSMALDWISAHPKEFAALLPNKFVNHISPIAFGSKSVDALPSTFIVFAWIGYLLIYTAATLGAYNLFTSGRWKYAAILLLLPIAILIPSLVSFGATRFALPAFPSIAVLAAIGAAPILNYGFGQRS